MQQNLTSDLVSALNYQSQLRPVAMIFPDCRPVVEVWLVSCGFTEARPLALKMTTFFKLINEQVIHNVMKNSEATLIVKRFSEDCCPFFFSREGFLSASILIWIAQYEDGNHAFWQTAAGRHGKKEA